MLRVIPGPKMAPGHYNDHRSREGPAYSPRHRELPRATKGCSIQQVTRHSGQPGSLQSQL